MPLQVDNSGPIKKVKGIYKGQQSWQNVGNILYGADDFPIFLGVFKGDTSASANIFFDPSRSALAKFFGSPMAGLIQVGLFSINHYELPVQFYNDLSNIPDANSFIDFNGRKYPSQVRYLDICNENSNGKRVNIPFYAFKQMANDASYDLNNFFRFPQTYGGLTKFDPRANNLAAIKRGENVTAFITSNEELSLGDLPPSLTFPDYISSLDPGDFTITATNLTGDSTFGQVDQYLQEQGLIPQSFLNLYTRIKLLWPVSPSPFGAIGDQRLLIQVPQPLKRTDGIFTYFSYLLICKNPINDGTLGLVWLDDDFENDYNDSVRESGPNIARLKDRIENEFSYSFFNFRTMQMSKRFVTFACNYDLNSQTNVVSIRMLEGISWGISNSYTDDKEWGNLQMLPHADCTRKVLERFWFKNAIERFYDQLSEELRLLIPYRVVWVDDFSWKDLR